MNALEKKIVALAAAAAAVLAAVALLRQGDGAPRTPDEAGLPRAATPGSAAGAAPDAAEPAPGPEGRPTPAEAGDGAAVVDADDATPDEDILAEEEEKKADAFDALTDRWTEKEGGEVSMKDMDAFVAAFKSVPRARKDECLHRALNLVSDEHVLLLAGILFDTSVEKEHLELVFNDILNRDEDVKKLILPRIYKDRTHPCWADAAWILDVTGELPQKENDQ